jgi:hypothetical protein
MPNWDVAPKVTGLDEILLRLEQQIDSNPSVEEVVGLTDEQLRRHALEAIRTIASAEDFNPLNPDILARIYCLGFVVGMKFGEAKNE